MRSCQIMKDALFSFEGEAFCPVALPHTWNALDGQDGGNDYRRGTGTYRLQLPDPTPGKQQYIEFQAAKSHCIRFLQRHTSGQTRRRLFCLPVSPYPCAEAHRKHTGGGGVQGRNNKVLVTYDRKLKKDAFYIYQAYWSKKPMLHIAGRRFANRAPGERDVTVYTNCEEVTLSVNGALVATCPAADRCVVFKDVPLCDGENRLTASCGDVSDSISLWGVPEHDGSYDLPDLVAALQTDNWFDSYVPTVDYGENGYHLDMCFGELLHNPQCFELIKGWAMSREHITIARRFRFVAGLGNWKNNAAYRQKSPWKPPPSSEMWLRRKTVQSCRLCCALSAEQTDSHRLPTKQVSKKHFYRFSGI